MKKLIVCVLTFSLLLSGCMKNAGAVDTTSTSQAQTEATTKAEEKTGGNFSDEMKIPHSYDLDEYGADSVERDGDHKNSPYFSNLDFYNMTSSDTLTIIPKFKTMQQTSEWSCGVTSALMVLEHFGSLGDHNEHTLAEMRTNGTTPGATTLESIVKIFDTLGGFDITSTFDFEDEDAAGEYMSLEKIQETLADGLPVMVAWNDWGGHWQVIIGYDTMGTETTQDDVLIMADPYDTTDHNQDGYTVYGAERFYYNWTMYDFFTKRDIDERSNLFCVVNPQNN